MRRYRETGKKKNPADAHHPVALERAEGGNYLFISNGTA